MKMKIIAIVCFSIMLSCNDDDEEQPTEDMNPPPFSVTNPPNVLGMDFTKSIVAFDRTYTALQSAIDANENIGIVAEVDHAANAASIDLELNPTRIIFFGNPNLGTPLMQQNQLAGLDLPQKILVYQNELEEVYAGFNNTTYLSSRHGLDGVATLPMIQGALENLSSGASQDSITAAAQSMPELAEGILSKTTSTKVFDDVYNSLQMAIENNPNLTIIAEVNHQANAQGIGQDLNPTRLIIFGNPNLGTPLMQSAQTTGLDLPQKMLVWQNDEGVVTVSYNDPAYLVQRHGITENETVLETISMALDNLSNAAIAE